MPELSVGACFDIWRAPDSSPIGWLAELAPQRHDAVVRPGALAIGDQARQPLRSALNTLLRISGGRLLRGLGPTCGRCTAGWPHWKPQHRLEAVSPIPIRHNW